MKTLNFLFVIGCCFAFVSIIDAASSSKRSKRDQCGKNELNQMDKLLASVLPFDDPKVKPPETIEDIPQFCLHYGDVLTKIESLNKRCMKETQRNVIAVMIYNIKQSTRGICSKKAIQSKKLTPAKKNFLQLNRCINGGSKQLKQCSDTMAGYLTAIEKVPKTQRIPMLCCEMIKGRDCFHNALRSGPNCNTPEFDKTLGEIVKSVGGGGESQLRSICGDFTTKAKCSKVKLPKRQAPKDQKSFKVPLHERNCLRDFT